MKQGYGKISLGGSDNNYAEQLQKISDKSMYNIIRAYYSVFLYGMLNSNGDIAEGYFSIGNYGESGRAHFKENNQSHEINIADEINALYQSNGINAIKPLTFNTSWTGNKSVQFSITAQTKTAPTVKITSVEGNSLFEHIVIKWNSTMQEKFTITATKGNSVKTYSGAKETFYSIDASDFLWLESPVEGSLKISLKVEFTNNKALSESAWASDDVNVSLKDTRPKLTELKAINNVITFKGKNLDNISAKIRIYNKSLNNAFVGVFNLSKNDIDNFKFEIPEDVVLYNGEHEVLLSIEKEIGSSIFEDKMNTTMIITNRPYVQINSLEPSNVSRNYEKKYG
ncbi:hypothetical protein HMPREF9629_00424 [Peptoanaerobacter stomatis]|uniref:Uncharacterized protein n=1 Tax=Peptoanaerobacter stomatis TaxID=796937 RepID=G9X201_9FIRM|nr:hypothetical protein [Peptoanaerobacter stomatis]EHL13124.1 hypothetical protein HMPREF9629_00424 [Peptoanaerobacter stomatis]